MKRFLFLCLLIPLPVVAEPKCQWVSEPTPEVVLQIGDVTPLGDLSADLVYKGKVIRSLRMGYATGYGVRWWAYEGKDGRSVGGRILPFKGNQPIRGTKEEDLDQSAPRKALLVGLGRDLYYSGFRREGEWDLIRAAEGFWQIPTNCDVGPLSPGRTRPAW